MKHLFAILALACPIGLAGQVTVYPQTATGSITINGQTCTLGGTCTIALEGAGTLTYYLQSTNSDLSNGSALVTTDKQALTDPQVTKTAVDIARNAAGDVILQSWATDPGFPGISFIPAGAYLLHLHAYTLSGNRNVTLYGVFREVTAAGAAVGTIGTITESTPTLTGAELEYPLVMAVANTYTMALSSSRIVLDLHAVFAGGGNNTTVRTYVGGAADSHIALPSNTVDATSFVPYSGAVSNLDLGAHALSLGGGSSNTVTCWKTDGKTLGYATVAEITAGTCH